MADDIDNTTPATTKIECNRKSIIFVLKCVEDNVRRSLSDMFNDSEYEMYVAKIVEAYRNILLRNTYIDGQNVNNVDDLDISSEYEPFDVAKEHYIQQELMDQFCQQIVKTTQLRKSGPKQADRKMKKVIRPELKYAALMTFDRNSSPEEAMETDEKSTMKNVTFDEVTSRFQTVTEKSSCLKPVCENVLEKAQNLFDALEIYHQSENSDLMKALYETPPNTPTTASDKLFIKQDVEKKIWKKLLLH